MARVLAVIRVFPSGTEVDVEDLASRLGKSLPKECALAKFEVEEIGFGIKVLRVYVLMPEDYEGGTARIEEAFSSVDGVSQVEVEYVTRVS